MAPPSELLDTARPAESFPSLKHLGPQNLIQQQDEEARKAFAAFAAQAPSTTLRCHAHVSLSNIQVAEAQGRNAIYVYVRIEPQGQQSHTEFNVGHVRVVPLLCGSHNNHKHHQSCACISLVAYDKITFGIKGDAKAKAKALHRTSGPQGQIEPLTVIDDPSAWTAASVKQADDWIYKLNASDISEIDSALELVASLNVRKEVPCSLRILTVQAIVKEIIFTRSNGPTRL